MENAGIFATNSFGKQNKYSLTSNRLSQAHIDDIGMILLNRKFTQVI